MSRRGRCTALGVALLATLAAGGCGLIPERSPGEKLWRKHCASCHGLGGAGNTPRYMGKAYADLLDDVWRDSGDDSSLEMVIREGVFGEMPAFDELSPEEMRQLLHYLRELRGEAAPRSRR